MNIHLRILAVLATSLLGACSTANNYKLPPWDVKRIELTCDRNTHNLPPGLMCYCVAYGSGWDCQVRRY